MQDEPKVLAEELATLSGPDIKVWLNNSGGYIALNWTNTGAIGRWDYVALYDTQPTDPYGYLTNQWQYTSCQSSPYVTWTKAQGTQGPNYWIGYGAWDYSAKEYKIVASAGPAQP
jgi:hypothetical protein